MADTRRNRPARRAAPAPFARGQRGGTLLGIFIGLVLGLGIAAAVAYTLMRNNPAFQPPEKRDAKEAAREAVRAKVEPEKSKLDFFKVLPGGDEAKKEQQAKAPERPDRAVVDQARERQNPKPAEKTEKAEAPADAKVASVEEKAPVSAKPGDRFWLQTGSFSTEADAENLRARLALAGWEANVQQGLTPDKAVRWRVRMGPYDNTDELTRMRNEVARRGFDVAIIKY